MSIIWAVIIRVFGLVDFIRSQARRSKYLFGREALKSFSTHTVSSSAGKGKTSTFKKHRSNASVDSDQRRQVGQKAQENRFVTTAVRNTGSTIAKPSNISLMKTNDLSYSINDSVSNV